MDNPNDVNRELESNIAAIIQNIKFNLFKINYNGSSQELNEYWELFRGILIAAKTNLSQPNTLEISKKYITELRNILLQGVTTSRERDSRWYYDNVLILYQALKYMNDLCDLLKIEKNNFFDVEFYKIAGLVDKNINLSRLITSPDEERERLRQENYWRYVTQEFSDSLYDNGISLWNTFRHPLDTIGKTFYGIRCLFWDVGPKKSVELIAKQVYKRPWYFGCSLAQSYAFNYAINKLTSKLMDISGLKDKINTYYKGANAASEKAKALKDQADETSNAIALKAQQIAKVEGDIQSLTSQLKAIPDAGKYCPVSEFESFSLYCYIQEYNITSDIEGLKKIVSEYEKLKTMLQEKLKLASHGSDVAAAVRDHLKAEALNSHNKLLAVENAANVASKVVEATTLSQRLLNGSVCFFQTMSNPGVRTALFEFDKLIKTANDLYKKLQIETHADPSPTNSTV